MAAGAVSSGAAGGGVGTIVVAPAPIWEFSTGSADVAAADVVRVLATSVVADIVPAARLLALVAEETGPIGVVPAETAGNDAVGRPESGDTPGCGGVAPMAAGRWFASVFAPARLVFGFRSRTERLGIVVDVAVVSDVPEELSAPMLLPPADPALVCPAVELVAVFVAGVAAVALVAAAPLLPDACANVWLSQVALQNAVSVRKAFVFMAVVEITMRLRRRVPIPPCDGRVPLRRDRPMQKTFVPAGVSG